MGSVANSHCRTSMPPSTDSRISVLDSSGENQWRMV
jgi:hypothetical protein